jgi:hypothetical protein
MKHQPDSLILIPSLRCNYQCEHCCRCSGPWRKERMSDRVFRAVRSLPDYFSSVTISGGEPFILSQDTWVKVFDHLPNAVGMLTVITNGSWVPRTSKRRWFLTWWVPHAQRIMEYHHDGISVCVSQDDYHQDRAEINRAWKWLKSEARDGYIEGCTDDDYFEPYPDNELCLGEHSKMIRYAMPIGRARRWGCEVGDEMCTEYCGMDLNGGEASHDITVWPDGRVSGCCNGGGWIGNILTMDLQDIYANQYRLFQEHRQQFPEHSGVTREACYNCVGTARRLFKTSFKEVQS